MYRGPRHFGGIMFARQRAKMLDALQRSGGMTPQELIELLGVKLQAVRSMRYQINDVFAAHKSPLRVTTDRARFYLRGEPSLQRRDVDAKAR